MRQTTMSVRIDDEVKRRFDEFCESAGMNASVAVNMFARAVLRERKIPFEISAYNAPNSETLEAIEEARRMKADPSIGKAYSDVDEMMKDILE